MTANRKHYSNGYFNKLFLCQPTFLPPPPNMLEHLTFIGTRRRKGLRKEREKPTSSLPSQLPNPNSTTQREKELNFISWKGRRCFKQRAIWKYGACCTTGKRNVMRIIENSGCGESSLMFVTPGSPISFNKPKHREGYRIIYMQACNMKKIKIGPKTSILHPFLFLRTLMTPLISISMKSFLYILSLQIAKCSVTSFNLLNIWSPSAW